jgi:hypothetical protein
MMMSCNCIQEVNEVLATRNTRLAVPIMFGGGPDRLLVETEQVERGRGKPKACSMFTTYCPFCGVLHAEPSHD